MVTMPPVKQYPHTMSWTGPGTPATVDPVTGFPVPGTPGETVTVQCRYENFGLTNRREWTGEDGKTIWQRGTVYVKFGEPVPAKFEHVTVADPEQDNYLEFEGPVLNVYTGQLNTTIAV